MKKRKIISIFLVIAALLIALPGCQQKAYSYPFTQDLENVVSVEIRKYDYDTKTTEPYLSLDEDTAKSLLQDISAIDSYKQVGDFPRHEFSEVVVYISYANGDAEVIGNRNTGRVDSAGNWWIRPYYFKDPDWNEMMSKYIGADLINSL